MGIGLCNHLTAVIRVSDESVHSDFSCLIFTLVPSSGAPVSLYSSPCLSGVQILAKIWEHRHAGKKAVQQLDDGVRLAIERLAVSSTNLLATRN